MNGNNDQTLYDEKSNVFISFLNNSASLILTKFTKFVHVIYAYTKVVLYIINTRYSTQDNNLLKDI